MNNNNSYNIFWIRHAESCANFLEYKILDKSDDDDNKLKDLIRKINNEDGINILNNGSNNISDNQNNKYKKLINEKYSELDIIINDNDKNNLSKNTNNCNKPYEKVILFKNQNPETCWKKITECKNKEDTICLNTQKKQKAIYVKNSMYKSAWLIEPTLSSVGILQSLNLGEEFNNMKFDDSTYYITSSMVRTVMTALLSMTVFNNKKSNIIYVVPYINEHTNWSYDTIKYDKQNMGNSSEELRSKITLMKTWIENNIDNYLEFITTVNENIVLNKNDFITNMNNIIIDYSILEKFEKEDENYHIENLDKFKNDVLPELFNQKQNSNQTKNIVAFSHGYFIRKIYVTFNKTNKNKIPEIPEIIIPQNLFHASISEENLTNNTTTNIKYLYVDNSNKYIRKKYIDTIDNNICSIKSLYGIVNNISPQSGGRISYTKYRKIKKTFKNAKTKKQKNKKNKISNKRSK
jgi:broad specificity phosphatase PhoE